MIAWLVVGIMLGLVALLGWRLRQIQTINRDLLSRAAHFQHQLEQVTQQADHLREGLFRAVEDALLVLNSEQRVLFANPAAESTLGQSLTNQHLLSVINQPDLDTLLQDAQMVRGEVVERRLEFDRHIFNARAVIYKSDRSTYEVLTLRDVTEIQRLERARREMVSNITHELSTPITAISLLAETLLNTAIKEKPKRSRKMAEDIQREVDTLTHLVQEIRDLSLIESGQMPIRLTPTELSSIVYAGVNPLLPLAENKQQTVTVEVPDEVLVLADDHHARRAIKNLVHNAIKFTQPGGLIQVTAALKADEVIIAVNDNGPGIPAADLPRIFERFFQVDKARRNGTGLGLAIVRHIVMAHGGHTWVESTENQGTTFYMSLVLAELPSAS